MFKITARDQGQYKGPSRAFVTHGNISCFFLFFFVFLFCFVSILLSDPPPLTDIIVFFYILCKLYLEYKGYCNFIF